MKPSTTIFYIMAMMALMASTPAMAAKVKDIGIAPYSSYNDGPSVYVYSKNGKKYHFVNTDKQTTYSVKTKARCRVINNISAKLTLYGFDRIKYLNKMKSDGSWARVKTAVRYQGGGQTDPVSICNKQVDLKVAQGRNRADILAKGFKVDYPNAYKASLYVECRGIGFTDTKTRTTIVPARIYCKSSPQAKPKPKTKPKKTKPKKTKLKPLIKSIIFSASPRTYIGRCPVGVKFKGNISSSRAGTVKYQYLSNDNKLSPVFTLSFAKAETKPVRLWSKVVNPEKKLGGRLSASGKPAYDAQGWLMLKVLSSVPSKTIKASYKVKCGKQTKLGIEHEDIGGVRKRPGRTKYSR